MKTIQPMLASKGDGPFDDPDWQFEIKFDGYRAIAYREDRNNVRLLTRNYKDVGDIFPEIKRALSENFDERFILDGEIIVLDDTRKSNFEFAQRRGSRRTKQAIEEGVKKYPALYVLYDIMSYCDGDVRNFPLYERTKILRQAINFRRRYNALKYIELAYIKEQNGQDLYKQVLEQKQEGMIAKNIHSTYQSGKRSKDWLKIFPVYSDVFYICGYTKIDSILKEGIGSLHLCTKKENEFHYVGKVGTGFVLRERIRLEQILKSSLPHSKPEGAKHFKGTSWVYPLLQCNIQYKNKTKDSNLRHPVYKGLI